MEGTVYISKYASPVGDIYIAVEGVGLVGLWLESQKYFAATIVKRQQKLWNCAEDGDKVTAEIMQTAQSWLDSYFRGNKPDPQVLPLKPAGSEFRQRVWEELLKVPYGKTTTYGEIAKTIAEERGLKSMSAQAVGGAVGHNPLSIMIPCHRVLGKDGSLTGYAGGLDKKIWLLNHEKISFKE